MSQLLPNAMRVWVDTPKVPTASVWRPTSELEFIEDAVGTTVAWPIDKVLMLQSSGKYRDLLICLYSFQNNELN